MNKYPLVSVVMPVYNASRFLDEAIESIIAQTYPHWELLLIDDGSSDNSREIISKWERRDSRIQCFFNEKNQGVAFSRNHGLEQAAESSKYIATMDADDCARTERFAKQVAYLESHPDISVLGSYIRLIDENGQILAHRKYPTSPLAIRRMFCRVNPIAHPATMIRRSIFKEFRYSKGKTCVDYVLFFKIAERYDLANLPDYLLDYRISSMQIKARLLKHTLKDTIRLQWHYLFSSRFFDIRNIFCFIAHCCLYLLPGSLVFALFKLKYYRTDNDLY